MFGGLCFLLNGNMVCGILNDDLIVRVGPQNYANALKDAYARQFDITGKPMKGWVMVSGENLQSDHELLEWVRRGANFALSLPPK
jgi:TfoX/Sxy family transcriptional regulator of competence genes